MRMRNGNGMSIGIGIGIGTGIGIGMWISFGTECENTPNTKTATMTPITTPFAAMTTTTMMMNQIQTVPKSQCLDPERESLTPC